MNRTPVTAPDSQNLTPLDGTCPPGCVEHYVGSDGTWNHSTALRSVTGDSATRDDHVVSVSTWMEVREEHGQPRVVGVVEKIREDVELCACQLRHLAQHLLDVADQVDASTAAIGARPAVVPATSEYVGRTDLAVRQSAIGGRSVHLHTGVSGEDLMLDPAAARRLAAALVAAAG